MVVLLCAVGPSLTPSVGVTLRTSESPFVVSVEEKISVVSVVWVPFRSQAYT